MKDREPDLADLARTMAVSIETVKKIYGHHTSGEIADLLLQAKIIKCRDEDRSHSAGLLYMPRHEVGNR